MPAPAASDAPTFSDELQGAGKAGPNSDSACARVTSLSVGGWSPGGTLSFPVASTSLAHFADLTREDGGATVPLMDPGEWRGVGFLPWLMN
jgi:hypothetical protein